MSRYNERGGKRAVLEATCDGKFKFDSFEHARHSAAQKTGPTAGMKLEPYRCPKCHGWHIGAGHKRAHRVVRKQRRQKAQETTE